MDLKFVAKAAKSNAPNFIANLPRSVSFAAIV